MEYSRLFQRAVLVLIIATAFCTLYGMFAVPVLEPVTSTNLLPQENSGPKRSIATDPRYQGIFKEGDWELTPDALLSSSSVHIFLREISCTANHIQGKECTILYYPKTAGNGQKQASLPLLIHIPEGIELRSDSADANSMKIGQINWGHIHGKIEGASLMDSANPNDDVAFTLKDVFYENGFLFTDEDVEFTVGQVRYKGRGMRMPMSPENLKSQTEETEDGENVSSESPISFIELAKLEYLDFRLTRKILAGMLAKSKTDAPQTGTTPAGKKTAEKAPAKLEPSIEKLLQKDGTLPVGLRCTGNVQLDLEQEKVTFTENVQLYAHYGTGVSDQMKCDTLEIDFHKVAESTTEGALSAGDTPATPSASAETGTPEAVVVAGTNSAAGPMTKDSSPMTKDSNGISTQTGETTEAKFAGNSAPSKSRVVLQQITATGKEVVLQSNEFAFSARGNLLQIDMQNKRLHLEGTMQETELTVRNVKCISKNIDYKFPDNQNALGNLTVPKNGWMQTEVLVDRRPALVRLNWRGDLEMSPDPSQPNDYQIRLHSATIDSEGLGKLHAPEALICLKKVPSSAKAPTTATSGNAKANNTKSFFKDYAISQLTASKDVTFAYTHDGIETEGVIGDVLIRFEQMENKLPAKTENPAEGAPQSGVSAAGNEPAQVSPNTPASSKTKFQIHADKLDGTVLLGSTARGIPSLKFHGNVTIAEQSSMESQITIHAADVILSNLSKESAEIQATGSPADGTLAEFQGRGIQLRGPSFNLSKGMNKIWADSPGSLTIPKNQFTTLNLPMTEPAGDLVVTYGKLNFDGLTMQLTENVSITHPAFALQAKLISLELISRLDMKDSNSWKALRQIDKQKVLDLFRSVIATGDVSFFGQKVEDGKRTQLFRLKAGALQYKPYLGDLTVNGPIFSQAYFYKKNDKEKNEKSTTPNSTPTENQVLAENPAAVPAANPPVVPPVIPSDGNNTGEQDTYLSRMDIKCNGLCTGNTKQGFYTLYNGFSLISDRVDDWSSSQEFRKDPATLSENGIILDADKLEMDSVPILLGQRQPMEFEPNLNATGNIKLETRRMSARAQRLSASISKAQVILEGDTTPVHLTLLPTVKQPGARMTGKTIQLNTKTMDFRGDDIVILSDQ